MVRWLPWSADAFARASREQKPVLLSITAAWCRACHEMDRTTYADPAVAALIHDRFVPVRVDTDRRPDINERYNLGGWPTTAFLTADGAVITGGTFVPLERMPGVLAQVASVMETVGASLSADSEPAADSRQPEARSWKPEAETAIVIESIFATFDAECGGFGIEPKFPHTVPLHLAMGLFHETGDERWHHIVRRTLEAMADGGLRDRASGGFYRYATTRDWQLPHEEKLLETNAALLRAAAVLDDSALAREALASFERVLLLCYRPGLGLSHYFDGAARVRGLLLDHVAVIGGLLEAHDASGLEPYRMMAEELGHIVVRDMRDEADGGFFDRASTPEDVGLLRNRRKPFIGNAEAALAFGRLSRLEPRKGFPDPAGFRAHAEAALAAAERQLDGQGPLAAHYALARRLLID